MSKQLWLGITKRVRSFNSWRSCKLRCKARKASCIAHRASCKALMAHCKIRKPPFIGRKTSFKTIDIL